MDSNVKEGSDREAEALLESPIKINRTDDEDLNTTEQAKQLLQSVVNQNGDSDNVTANYQMAESIIVKDENIPLPEPSPRGEELSLQAQQSLVVQNRAKLNMQQTMTGQEQEEAPPEENGNLIAENHFYPDDHIDQEKEDTPISRACMQFHDTFGHDSLKRYNLWLVDDNTVTFAAGISYNFMNFSSGQSQIFFSRDGGGIGSICVHTNKKFYGVAEKGQSPNVYIYSYPDHRLYRILRKGTERSYSSCTFSNDGEKFATVGSNPDYQICIWDWKQETILLKAKAFAQEVYRVQFSNYNPNILCTSGMGHIKFWKVAETFTGLKLKGEIAKFGQVELSDVYAFYQLADGKVLSGTEYGRLILWEGNVIKCVVGESAEKACHQGQIEVVFLDGEYVVTAGTDGYIKLWKFSEIDQAEGDDQQNFFLLPSKEILLESNDGDVAFIQAVQRTDQYWIIGDAKGRIWKIELPDFEKREIIFKTNSGKVYDLAVSPISNNCITVGQDGFVRLWDYVNGKIAYERKFPAEATCIEWVPFTKRNQARVVLVGFSNGILRMLLLKQDSFYLLKALKVHSSPITHMKVTYDGSLAAVAAKNGHIFLLQIAPQDIQQIEPLCLFDAGFTLTDMTFDRRGEKLLMGNKDGKVAELKVPRPDVVDNSQTYLVKFDPKQWTIKMMESQKPKKEEMDLEFLLRRNKDEKIPEVEWEPAPILNLCYYDNDCNRILVVADGKFLGNLYIVDWSKDRPVDAFYGPKIPTQFMNFQDNNELLVIGYKNGSFQLRHRADFRYFTQRESHDMDYGRVRKVLINFDKTAVLCCGDDGTLYVYKVDYQGIVQAARGVYIENFQVPELGNGINSGTFSEEIPLENPLEEDIINDKIYSIQEAKLLAEEDNKKTEAEKKKEKKLHQIKELRAQFQNIWQANLQTDESSKLDADELCVDPQYVEMLHRRVEEDLDETRKELEWDSYQMKLMTDKLKKYVKDELEVDRFAVKAIRNPKNHVFTFKVGKLSNYVQQNLAEIYRLIEEEKKNQAQKEQEQMVQKSQTNDPSKTLQQSLAGQTQLPNTSSLPQDFNKSDAQLQEEGAKISSAKAERERQKQEEEKIRREQEELEKTKPTKESFEPDHLRDIQEANETLGDYKLKSSKDYIVPKHQIMNVSKKRKHMFLLEEFIYNTKIKFNQQLINLRQRKIAIIDKIRRYNEQILKINNQLGKVENLFTPTLDKQLEDPDSYMNITDEQIDDFARQRLKDTQKKAGGFGGMGGGGAPAVQTQAADPSKTALKPGAAPTTVDASIKTRKGIRVQHSELEDEMKVIQEMILQAEKQRMLDEIDEEIEQFDKDVVKCQKEKQVLESDMVIAKMKLVTFYQELIILQDMEEYDNKLIKELLDCKKEKMSLDEQSQRIVENLTNLAKKEQQNEKELNEQMKAFKELVYPDDDHKREKIHQYYLRKYKKDKAKKMKATNQDDDGDEDDEDNESEEEEEEEEFMDDDDDEKPDISPVENDVKIKEIIDKICELEDNQEINRKDKMDYERQKVQIANKNVLIQKDLERAEEELRNYQRKKLQRVNQLDVAFMLKLSQIQNMIPQGDSFRLPSDLTGSILFTESDFYRICKRIRELELEQKKIDRQKKVKERNKKVVEKEIAIKNVKIDDLHKKYEEKHMLKFGDIIDLKILDALEPTKQVLDMRDVFKHEEKEAVKKVEEAKKSLQNVKKKLLDAKKENTKIINNITKLGKQQMDLSKKLDSTNKQLFKEENEERRSDLEREKQNLKDLVKFLSKEIEDLKTEIGLFKRKGGHIYTMVTSTKKQFN